MARAGSRAAGRARSCAARGAASTASTLGFDSCVFARLRFFSPSAQQFAHAAAKEGSFASAAAQLIADELRREQRAQRF
jgi:hypothetical protein